MRQGFKKSVIFDTHVPVSPKPAIPDQAVFKCSQPSPCCITFAKQSFLYFVDHTHIAHFFNSENFFIYLSDSFLLQIVDEAYKTRKT